MSHRFYVAELVASPSEVALEGEEARHLVSVCRARPGERIELFNGRGMVAQGAIVEVGKRHAIVATDRFETIPPPRPMTIASALPKGDRVDFLVEKCVELDVSHWIPLKTERSVVHARETKLDRLRRHVLEACKQSGRSWTMEIGELTPLPELLASHGSGGWLLTPRGAHGPWETTALPEIVAIGPEGGWTEAEEALARERGWSLVRLPGNVLRIETAAIAVASLLRYLRYEPETPQAGGAGPA